MKIALINTNRVKPPISPVGLEYVAEALERAGHEVYLLDLCWAEELEPAIDRFFQGENFNLVGVTIRNTDDCAYPRGHSFLPECSEIIGLIRKKTDAPVVLGGVGFSVMPEVVMEFCGGDLGVWSDGEFTMVSLAGRMERGEEYSDLPNLVIRRDARWARNEIAYFPLEELPPMKRRWVDNPRYFREGGQIGFETKRGCPKSCVFCADPVAKGRKVRLRLPSDVADELASLLDQGIDHLHTCDSEFNIPGDHAASVCEEIIRRNLGERLRWYAYCSPVPFSRGLAQLMRRAGCVGINFGVDSGDERVLESLGRDFGPEEIVNAARFCREAGIVTMFDLLIGSPWETMESVKRTIELMRRAAPDRVGVTVGVRVYPGTPLAKELSKEKYSKGLTGGHGPADPLFFIEPELEDFVFEYLEREIGDDERFLFFYSSREDKNYNYAANEVLVDAIKKGCRGAYWDILRRCSAG